MHEPTGRLKVSKEPLSILLPVYNQVQGLEPIVESWLRELSRLGQTYEFIVVNDGSTDGTADALGRLATRHASIRAVHHDARRGFGASLRTGLAEARNPLVFYTACDYPYQPIDLKKLLEAIDGADLVTGCRTDPVPNGMQAVGRVYRLLVRIIFGIQLEPRPGWYGWATWREAVRLRVQFGLRLWDVPCSFKLFRRSVLDRIPIQSDGDFVHAELLAKANFLGTLMAEVPIGRLHGAFRGVLEPPPNVSRAAEIRQVFRRPLFTKPPAPSEQPGPTEPETTVV